jgi:hypothetical protein
MDLEEIPWVLIVFLLLAAGGLGWAGYSFYQRSQAAKLEGLAYFNCPGCRRKIKYRMRQAGHRGQCSNCKSALTFPDPDHQRRS